MDSRPRNDPARHHGSPAGAGDHPLRVLVAAGPTHEPIDDVRYIGNRSSGRMGTAIAGAFLDAGCTVTLARGPGVATVDGCTDRRFGTAAELLALLNAEWPGHDLLVMAAAVADYRPARRVDGKLRREDGPLTLQLEPTQDILSGLAGTRSDHQYVVGFALERPEELAASAAAKLARKRADALVANPLETLDSADVDGRVLFADGRTTAPSGGRIPKAAFAAWLAALILPLAEARVRATA
jgi:phosphopantothenoylcysteine decarboxylase/phosphopantothenate--cysteine ligase